jgi:hypothetical protein
MHRNARARAHTHTHSAGTPVYRTCPYLTQIGSSPTLSILVKWGRLILGMFTQLHVIGKVTARKTRIKLTYSATWA